MLTKTDRITYFDLSIVSILETIIFISFSTKSEGVLINYSNVFIICLFLFTFGQVILLGFFPDASDHLTIVLRYFDEQEAKAGLVSINYAYVVLCEGILLAQSGILYKYKIIEKEDNFDKIVIESRAKQIIWLSFPIKIIVDSVMLLTSLNNGFSAGKAFLLSIPDIVVTFGNFALIGFGLLIVSYRDQPQKQTRVFLFVLLYICVMMFSGRRSENVSYLAVLAYIYISSRNIKISIRKTVVFIGVLYLAASFLNFIVALRNSKVESFNELQSLFVSRMTKHNMFLEALREYGNTVYTALCVNIRWLPFHSPSYGKSYLYGLSAILPNISGTAGQLTRESNYGFVLQDNNILTTYYYNIGGSLLGEFFFNFGIYGGLVAALIFGYYIGFFSKKTSILFKKSVNYTLAYYLPVMFSTLYWIRDYFSGSIREIVWGIVFCWIIKHTFRNKGATR